MSMIRLGDILECKQTTNVIACLMIRETMRKSEIYRATSSNPRMAKKLEFLEDEGFILMTEVGNSTIVSLTEKGKFLGSVLFKTELRLYGDMSEDFKRFGTENSVGDACPICGIWDSISSDIDELFLPPTENHS